MRHWIAGLIVFAVILATASGYTALAYLMEELHRPKPVTNVMALPYSQGAPRATDYRDDGKPECERRCVDPPTLFEFFDGFTFSVGRTGKATYYYRGEKILVDTKRIRIKAGDKDD